MLVSRKASKGRGEKNERLYAKQAKLVVKDAWSGPGLRKKRRRGDLQNPAKPLLMDLPVMVRFSSFENLLCQVEFCRSNQHRICTLLASPQGNDKDPPGGASDLERNTLTL